MADDDMTAELATADMEEETKERTVQERREAFIAAAENTEDPTALLEFVNQHVSPRPRALPLALDSPRRRARRTPTSWTSASSCSRCAAPSSAGCGPGCTT